MLQLRQRNCYDSNLSAIDDFWFDVEVNMAATKRDQPKAGYDCQFVDSVPEPIESDCAICLLTLREPHLTSCCGHNFCRRCIEEVTRNERACPLCNTGGFTAMHNKGLERALKGMTVLCEHKGSGCGWKGGLGRLDAHLEKECSYVAVECKYGCGFFARRKDVRDHQETCSLRPFRCDFCTAYESTFDDVVNNHRPLCSKFLVTCPNNCGEQVKRQDIKLHIDNDCPHTSVDCEFSYAGCNFKPARKSLNTHLKDCLLAHVSLVSKMNRQLMYDNSNLAAELTRQMAATGVLEAKVESLLSSRDARIDALEKECTRQRSELDRLRGSERALINYIRETNGLEIPPFTIELVVPESSREWKTASLERSREWKTASLERSREWKTASLERSRGNTASPEPLRGLKTASPEPSRGLKTASPEPSKAASSDSAVLLTNEFYTHFGGYKLQLRFHVKTNVVPKASFGLLQPHVFLTVHVMRGEFDKSLGWPFDGTVEVSVGRGLQHFINFQEAPAECTSRIYETVAEKGWGPKEPITGVWRILNGQPLRLEVVVDGVRFPKKAATEEVDQGISPK